MNLLCTCIFFYCSSLHPFLSYIRNVSLPAFSFTLIIAYPHPSFISSFHSFLLLPTWAFGNKMLPGISLIPPPLLQAGVHVRVLLQDLCTGVCWSCAAARVGLWGAVPWSTVWTWRSADGFTLDPEGWAFLLPVHGSHDLSSMLFWNDAQQSFFFHSGFIEEICPFFHSWWYSTYPSQWLPICQPCNYLFFTSLSTNVTVNQTWDEVESVRTSF